jgi:hypothetical protein
LKTRGTYNFEFDEQDKILPNEVNFHKLRTMFLDRNLINGEFLGPGDKGDFDFGSWHILCHLTAACAVFKKSNSYIWTEISHIPFIDKYTATVTIDSKREAISTFPLYSTAGQEIVQGSELIGFVEGSSFGHISARDSQDDPKDFNNNLRQEYDNDVSSIKEGGRVWEHWVVTRNISELSHVGSSILLAYLEMLSICGGIYTGIVGRGRVDYHHPQQLKALEIAGLIKIEEALLDIMPKPIAQTLALKIYTANPKICIETIKYLPWDINKISYFMFQRKINNWNTKENFKKLI